MKSAVFDGWRDEVVAKANERNAERHLQRWLEGAALPPIDSYTEGHAWLWEAAKDVPRLRSRLATLAAQLIESYRERNLESRDLPRFQFNLFYFCAELRQPDVLWKPLLRILEDKAVPATNNDSGEYQGVPLIAALRAAIAGNQADLQKLDMWRDMLEDKPDTYLAGTPMDGFEGVIALPGPPNEALVGWALARMSDYLHDSPFRTRQFKQLLPDVQARFSDHPWDFELLAARCEWKPWAQKLVGDPMSLVRIEYARIPTVEYLRGDNKTKMRIRLPRKYKSAKLDHTIRQLALDFCKEPPPDGILVPLIEHLLPRVEGVSAEENMAAHGKGVARGKFEPIVLSLRENEAA